MGQAALLHVVTMPSMETWPPRLIWQRKRRWEESHSCHLPLWSVLLLCIHWPEVAVWSQAKAMQFENVGENMST